MITFLRYREEQRYLNSLCLLLVEVHLLPLVRIAVLLDLFTFPKDSGHSYCAANCSYCVREFHLESCVQKCQKNFKGGTMSGRECASIGSGHLLLQFLSLMDEI